MQRTATRLGARQPIEPNIRTTPTVSREALGESAESLTQMARPWPRVVTSKAWPKSNMQLLGLRRKRVWKSVSQRTSGVVVTAAPDRYTQWTLRAGVWKKVMRAAAGTASAPRATIAATRIEQRLSTDATLRKLAAAMKPRAADIIDDRFIRGLHVEAVRRSGLLAGEEPHSVFQTSTLDALLEGDFDGDLTFAELAEHGDLGLGTLNGLDGEMIALDGRFLRADVDGAITEVPRAARTPFAVVTFFAPTVSFAVDGSLDHDAFVKEIDRHAPPGSPVCAVRADGVFDLVRARSVPRHEPPYPSLTEIAHEQHVFEFSDVEGTIVGFRFPHYAQGLEVAGYHLHFVDAARRRGGHVLTCRPRRVDVQVDHARELHVELPPGTALGAPDGGAETTERIRRIEGDS